MKPTKDQILSEIARLKEIKPRIPKFNYFNENNHAQIDAEIEVMEKNMSDDDIYNKWEDPENYDTNRSIINAALGARNWIDDKSEDGSPSENWENLVR